MSKYGIILTGYNCREYYASCLDAWIKARKFQLGCHEFVICAVSVKFAGFPNDGDDGTTDLFRESLKRGEIDHLIDGPHNILETTARTMALHWLQDQGCLVSWIVDLDEIYTLDNIGRIMRFVSDNLFVNWFRLSLKNFVFDEKTYLAEPFQPPRIHRLKVGAYRANSFMEDNDIEYTGMITRDLKPQGAFTSLTVPKETAWIVHFSWLSDERSRKKYEYQKSRGWNCSFVWDDSQGGLIFNPALPEPKIVRT